jgi:hypothetical protein
VRRDAAPLVQRSIVSHAVGDAVPHGWCVHQQRRGRRPAIIGDRCRFQRARRLRRAWRRRDHAADTRMGRRMARRRDRRAGRARVRGTKIVPTSPPRCRRHSRRRQFCRRCGGGLAVRCRDPTSTGQVRRRRGLRETRCRRHGSRFANGLRGTGGRRSRRRTARRMETRMKSWSMRSVERDRRKFAERSSS